MERDEMVEDLYSELQPESVFEGDTWVNEDQFTSLWNDLNSFSDSELEKLYTVTFGVLV